MDAARNVTGCLITVPDGSLFSSYFWSRGCPPFSGGARITGGEVFHHHGILQHMRLRSKATSKKDMCWLTPTSVETRICG